MTDSKKGLPVYWRILRLNFMKGTHMVILILVCYTILVEKMVKNNGKATVGPKVLIKTVLKEMHGHFGHFSVGKAYAQIKRYYYWPKMSRNIQTHIGSCSLCMRKKLQTDKYQLQTTEIPLKPFGKVSIDLVVDLPTSDNGNKNILVMADHLTGWPMAKAIPDKEVITVARAVYEELILEHGSPEILQSDNGKNLLMIPRVMCVKSSA